MVPDRRPARVARAAARGGRSEAAYRVRLGSDRRSLEWHINTADGEQTFIEEPDTGWWQRFLLRLIGPLVPEGQL